MTHLRLKSRQGSLSFTEVWVTRTRRVGAGIGLALLALASLPAGVNATSGSVKKPNQAPKVRIVNVGCDDDLIAPADITIARRRERRGRLGEVRQVLRRIHIDRQRDQAHLLGEVARRERRHLRADGSRHRQLGRGD